MPTTAGDNVLISSTQAVDAINGYQMPLFTEEALVTFLGDGSLADFSLLTHEILAGGGGVSVGYGNETTTNPYAVSDTAVCRGWTLSDEGNCTDRYIPPTVTTYRECFETMVDTDAYQTTAVIDIQE